MKYTMIALLCSTLSFNAIAQATIIQPGNPSDVKISSERLKRIDQLLQSQIDNGLINGAVGLVARDGKIIYYKALGVDDTDKKIPLKTDAIFRIASQTKAITSVAVMMLFEEGKIMLDDSVSKYIPAFTNQQVIDQFNSKDTTYTTKPAKRAITIRDLLTHTSGIDYTLIGSDTMKAIYAKAGIPAGFVLSDQMHLSDAMNKLAKLPLRHQPGQQFTYGLNMDVLGYLVEVVSKMSFDQFLQQRLFKPLGMEDTYFYLPPSKYSRLVTVYSNVDKQHLKKWGENDWPYVSTNHPKAKGTYFSGGGGLSSTGRDYAIFLQMLLNGGQYNGQRILSKHTVDLMTSNQIGKIPWNDSQFYLDRCGLGFAIITKAGQARLGQSEGSFEWAGIYNTFYWVDPREKLVCLLFTQQLPFSWKLSDRYKVAVYRALDD
jgi:CubicO group peptidase (beta-lactamase class C family)